MVTGDRGRIAKNTFLLFFRMFFISLISLYTSRLTLNILGISDYGIYSLVGGVVLLLSFLNSSMTATIQRFYNIEIAKNNDLNFLKLFHTSRSVQLFLAIFVFIILQLLGNWLIYSKLKIPESRIEAAYWSYQLAIISFVLSMSNVPYRALIIANEKMGIFAVISILEVSLKLAAIVCLSIVPGDKLITYSSLILLTTVLVNASFKRYCIKKYSFSKGRYRIESEYFSALINFSFWSLLSNISVVLRNQGISILLNFFYGVIVNAAHAITLQVSGILNSFISNFTQAANPQIVKLYAQGDLEEMKDLVLFSSRISFLLILLIGLPFYIYIELFLNLWLSDVPPYVEIFTKLVIVQIFVEAFSSVQSTAQAATGKIKLYHLVLSGIGLLNIPVAYFFLSNKSEPQVVFMVSIFLSGIISVARLFFLKNSIHLSIKEYLTKVIVRCIVIAIICVGACNLIKSNFQSSVVASGIGYIISTICTLVVCFLLGLNRLERSSVYDRIKKAVK
ncbi:multi antimicrobial extrusion protein MatE [Leadbetterella byssophila DSM 17132]|uniref:Multi antimicrobial extrusion protein MatE n=2 Tax=Leadbetterella TaxID=319458 RepID=E4RXQ4_LEAB4|nr:multi antimicrobial extrusion protein MatE [Leadbetterella byssophila DSM 17132]